MYATGDGSYGVAGVHGRGGVKSSASLSAPKLDTIMKKIAFLPVLLILNTALFVENVSGKTVVSIPSFNPDSDDSFAAEFQNGFAQYQNFFYFDALGELIYIPSNYHYQYRIIGRFGA
jgi:hypothetical protein